MFAVADVAQALSDRPVGDLIDAISKPLTRGQPPEGGNPNASVFADFAVSQACPWG